MPLNQENRTLLISSPLGENALVLTRFSGTEYISAPFSFELDLVSEDDSIAFEDIIGGNVTVSIGLVNDEPRLFNGLISRFSQDAGSSDEAGIHTLARYTATLVPWFWLLNRTTDSRIFQALSVPDIVEQIFTEKGFTDYRLNLGSYDPIEYCVQYRETDFNFISRLLEQEGIYYYFEHEDGVHTMVLADSPDGHPPCPLQSSARYHFVAGSEVIDEDVITDLDKSQEIRIGKYTVNDYNFEMPNANLRVEVDSGNSLGPGDSGRYEVYDYPAEFKLRADGERLANLRIQAEEARTTTIKGTGNCRAFAAGYRFSLTDHYRSEMNDHDFVLTGITHGLSEGAGGSDAGSGVFYTNSFDCIPFEVPFRPALKTPKPIIAGAQTALVVGPAGEEIYTDEHARVKVQFPWDREGQYNEDSSCFIRVGQTWAGTGWGGVYIPRIGQEVIVEFLEGDPDRPIVTGCVYNGINTPPYPLPDEKTKSTIKSMSSTGGGGFNEIRFEDKKGSEQLFIHAQSAQDNRVKGVSREFVGGSRHLIVKNDQLEKVDKDKHVTVRGDHKEKVDGAMSLTVEGDYQQKTGIKYAVESQQEIHLKAGMKVVIEGGLQVTLKGPGGFVDIGPAGVTIQGTLVNINSGGAAGVGSGSSPDIPDEPHEADTADPGTLPERPEPLMPDPSCFTPQANALQQAAKDGAPFCEL